ncbi:glycosyltransferase [Blastococcus jejuensis]|uniref:Glycosyltransferase n=1 Tax=Blastococcus jejuensis TaxID=351224 RepID=A0ABP6P0Z2_9ACTN
MARLLFTCRPLAGHYEPLLPLARAARDAGHAVAFATGEPLTTRAREDGFDALPAGPGRDFRAEWGPRFPGWDRLVGDEQRRFFLTEIFADLELVPRAHDLDGVLDRWGPDLVVHEMAELAAPLVCTARGLPYVDVSYGPLIPAELLRAAGRGAARHWRARGLEPHPVAGLLRHLYVDVCPPSLQNEEIASVPMVAPMRPVVAAPTTAAVPDWLAALPDRPLVYVTLGTVYNRDLSVFAAVLDGLRDEPVSVVVTIGQDNDPAALGPQPAHVAVHRYVPQAALLQHCSAAVVHGGAGTVLGALAAGVPLVCLPQGADQYGNADRVVAAGAGLTLLRDELTPQAVRAAVSTVLEDPGYRLAARRVAGEIAAMPAPVEALAAITRLIA